jgi:hypothetical protein
MDDKPLCGQYFRVLNYAVGDTHSVRTKITKSLHYHDSEPAPAPP